MANPGIWKHNCAKILNCSLPTQITDMACQLRVTTQCQINFCCCSYSRSLKMFNRKLISLFLVIFLSSLSCGNSPSLVLRKFEYKYSFKPPYLAQKDNSVPFWEYGGSKFTRHTYENIHPADTTTIAAEIVDSSMKTAAKAIE